MQLYRGIFQNNSLDCNKRGDLTALNLLQSTAKQYGKKPTTIPFVPDNSDERISELLLDTTVVLYLVNIEPQLWFSRKCSYISVILLTVSSPLSEISLSYLQLVWLNGFKTMIVILVRHTRSPSSPLPPK